MVVVAVAVAVAVVALASAGLAYMAEVAHATGPAL